MSSATFTSPQVTDRVWNGISQRLLKMNSTPTVQSSQSGSLGNFPGVPDNVSQETLHTLVSLVSSGAIKVPGFSNQRRRNTNKSSSRGYESRRQEYRGGKSESVETWQRRCQSYKAEIDRQNAMIDTLTLALQGKIEIPQHIKQLMNR